MQSHVGTNNDYVDDEDMLIDYETSDDEETSFGEIFDKINKDIDIYFASSANNHNLLNLTSNSLNEEE